MSDNNSDTVNLLRECSSGVKIALDGINSLLKYSKTPALKRILQKSVVKHEEIACEVSRLLLENESSDGTPPAVMTAIEKGQISAKMLVNCSASETAHIITDGCNMGIKQIGEYKNKYKHASPAAKNAADELIMLQENFSAEMRPFL